MGILLKSFIEQTCVVGWVAPHIMWPQSQHMPLETAAIFGESSLVGAAVSQRFHAARERMIRAICRLLTNIQYIISYIC